MMVREQCPKPLVHDLEITIVPFLQTFVDSSGVKRGTIKKGVTSLHAQSDQSEMALTCACCDALSNIEHISAILASLLRNSRRNALILQRKKEPAGQHRNYAGDRENDAVNDDTRGLPRASVAPWEGEDLHFPLRQGAESGGS